jgi:hypothetical protein
MFKKGDKVEQFAQFKSLHLSVKPENNIGVVIDDSQKYDIITVAFPDTKEGDLWRSGQHSKCWSFRNPAIYVRLVAQEPLEPLGSAGVEPISGFMK